MITVFGLQKLGFTPLVDFELEGIGDGVQIVKWNSELPQPTEDEIEAAKAEYDNLQYQRNRKEEYPTWQEQMDMMYHDQTEGSRTWLDAIEAVKSRFPKND